eukprot:TRINITY_DN8344_c0_g1_i4.p1 TRINITY_DN8344_c0_g1~~TRINITY_DN8344_c0_g1_i4.p1  ORF type:complete len:237 (+),score=34.55 TRINITY_DN8344_c0_g1_i4:688-1398(+)
MLETRPLHFGLGEDTNVRVIGESHLFVQNLVGNAIKFTPAHQQGEVVVMLHITRRQSTPEQASHAMSSLRHRGHEYKGVHEPRGTPTDDEDLLDVHIEVRDNGIGIAEPALARLRQFQPFTQEDNSTTKRYGGTGLGLPICHQICQAMGGRISIDSTQGMGTVVNVWLPFRRDPGQGVPASARPILDAEGGSLHGLEGARVAVFSESTLMRSVVRHYLQRARIGTGPRGCIDDFNI